jgi:glucan phosphoethanolaminetransferase (alkaline phosphatase superfamily)
VKTVRDTQSSVCVQTNKTQVKNKQSCLIAQAKKQSITDDKHTGTSMSTMNVEKPLTVASATEKANTVCRKPGCDVVGGGRMQKSTRHGIDAHVW